MAASKSFLGRVRGLFKRKPDDKTKTTPQDISIPSTQQPSTQQPSTQQPSTQQPTIQQPSTQQPAVAHVENQQAVVAENKAAVAAAANTSPTLQVQLQNQTNSSQVWAYISKIPYYCCLKVIRAY